MSSTPKFEEDIFISYAQVDNHPPAEGLKGWIDILHERLGTRLAQLLGEEVKIWRDPKLQGNDHFEETLLLRLSNIAVLVSVLSPRYLKSEWCQRELNEFCKRAAINGGVRIGDKSRIFKVIKTHIPQQEHPADLQGLLGYKFYEIDQTQGRAEEFNPDVLPYRDLRYWKKLEDLANDIMQLIKTLRPNAQSEAVLPTSQSGADVSVGATLYLAETTSDLNEERDQIKRELQQRGHVILPDRELPLNGSELVEAVREYLQRSQLSVHLIGARYGIIPEEESRSIIEVQNDLAAERGTDFQRLVWLPPGLQAMEERQQKFIDALRLGLNGHGKVEFLQTKLEDLKTQIHSKLSSQQESSVHPDKTDQPLSLYLICNKQDYEDATKLETYLYDQGLEVLLPVLEGDEAQVAQDHKDKLLYCDAVMIYYGRASEVWLRMKLRELVKIAGYGRTEPLLAKAVYVAAPQSPNKDLLKSREATVIRNYDAFKPELLKPFLAELQAAKGAQR